MHTVKRKVRTPAQAVSLWSILLGLDDIVENAREEEREMKRELPFSFAQNKLATPIKSVREERKTIDSDADAEPCVPGLNSEEFMEFLKRRREARREVQQQNDASLFWCGHPDSCMLQERMNPPDYKYVDVVRHKETRSKMDPYECPDCKAFYKSFDGKRPMPTCHHQYKTPDSLCMFSLSDVCDLY